MKNHKGHMTSQAIGKCVPCLLPINPRKSIIVIKLPGFNIYNQFKLKFSPLC